MRSALCLLISAAIPTVTTAQTYTPVFKDTTTVFQARMESGGIFKSHSAACAAAMPSACSIQGNVEVCYSNPMPASAGCAYTVTTTWPDGTVYVDGVTHQGWAYPRQACSGSGWLLISGRCARNIMVQDKEEVCTKNPVFLGSGTKRQREADLDIADPGIAFSRYFYTQSLNSYEADFGLGWGIDPWTRSLGFSISGTGALLRLLARRDMGRTTPLSKGGDGIWRPYPRGPFEVAPSGSEWILTDKDSGTVERYDGEGRLLVLQQPNGRHVTLEYGPDGLSRVSGLSGRAITFTYVDGQIARLDLENSSETMRFLWGSGLAGLLDGVSYADGASRQYTYKPLLSGLPSGGGAVSGWTLGSNGYGDDPGEGSDVVSMQMRVAEINGFPVATIVDELGITHRTYDYDASGRAISTERAGGLDRRTISYATDQATLTDPLGSQYVYDFTTVQGRTRLTNVSQPGGSGCIASTAAVTHDYYGNRASETDFDGNKICYQHDLARNLERARLEGVTGNCPSSVNSAQPQAGQRKISKRWHPLWNFETKRAEPKRITSWVYNGQPDPSAGNAIASCAPAGAALLNGQLLPVLCKRIVQPTTDENGGSGFSGTADGAASIWSYTYDSAGRLLTEDGPRTDVSDVTTYSYYTDASADHKPGDLWKVTNALGHVTEFTRYDAAGRVLELRDRNGVTTSFQYGLRGWLTQRSTGAQSTTYTYDPRGLLTRITGPDGAYIAYSHDDAHRLVGISDAAGNRIDYVLDAAGNRTDETVKDASGALKRRAQMAYDALSRLQRVVLGGAL